MAVPRRKRVDQPRYRQLAETLLGEIRSGKLPVGERMPGELELVAQYEVSRHTVREALRVLEELGLIARQPGVGTVVQADAPAPSYVQMVRSPSELLQYPDDSRLTVVESVPLKANRALARQLKCRVGDAWNRIGAIRRQRETGLAIGWSDIYVLPEFAGVAKHIGRTSQPVYEVIADTYDEPIDSVDIDIAGGTLDADLAERLDAEPGAPSLIITRRYVGRGQRQFEVSVSVHPAERFNYTLTMKRGWQSHGAWAPET
ncbi:MAG: GntR family transcriptional regulator [Pseudomonadota bacterium]